MSPISWSVTLGLEELTEGQTVSLIGFMHLTNGPNKLECYITVSWKGLPGTNTPTYWVIN